MKEENFDHFILINHGFPVVDAAIKYYLGISLWFLGLEVTTAKILVVEYSKITQEVFETVFVHWLVINHVDAATANYRLEQHDAATVNYRLEPQDCQGSQTAVGNCFAIVERTKVKGVETSVSEKIGNFY